MIGCTRYGNRMVRRMSRTSAGRKRLRSCGIRPRRRLMKRK